MGSAPAHCWCCRQGAEGRGTVASSVPRSEQQGKHCREGKHSPAYVFWRCCGRNLCFSKEICNCFESRIFLKYTYIDTVWWYLCEIQVTDMFLWNTCRGEWNWKANAWHFCFVFSLRWENHFSSLASGLTHCAVHRVLLITSLPNNNILSAGNSWTKTNVS